MRDPPKEASVGKRLLHRLFAGRRLRGGHANARRAARRAAVQVGLRHAPRAVAAEVMAALEGKLRLLNGFEADGALHVGVARVYLRVCV